ncbi:MAG: S9 family peptidase, partial [Candidatus Coatesbacteria bacterium]
VAIVEMNRREASVFDVYTLDLRTGEETLIAENRGDIYGWDVDAELAVRGANVVLPDGGEQYLVRDDASGPWRVLVEWDYEESMGSGSIRFAGAGDWVYLLDSREANAARLTKMNIHTGEAVVVGADPQYDVERFLFHPDTDEIQAYAVYRARCEWTAVEEAVREDFDVLARLDPGDFYVEDRDHADRLWVVRYDRDDASRQYYLYDRESQEGTFLFERRPELSKYVLAPMEPISFAARDGLTIHGYATFPPGKPRANLPTVLYVHGGPHVRDRWAFHSLVQGLANRGYLVLRINYRGSSGYGKAYLNAGRKEWGGAMQDDLTDAVAWAVAQGWTDAERVAIMGGSYGGYAALAGATFTPDLYACAVAAMGPSNLITFLETIPPYWKPFLARMKLRVGDPETEADFLRSRSPLFHVDRIKIPMLLVYGANDARVKLSEGEQIREAMEAKGIDYEYLVFADEGHGFQQPHNRLRYVAAAEGFLAKHLGGRYEPYEEE